ncbi:MAG: type IV secretion system protein [Rickettsiales bacterium]|nr:type IV secretion system protein [Rickettsiales bacterium]
MENPSGGYKECPTSTGSNVFCDEILQNLNNPYLDVCPNVEGLTLRIVKCVLDTFLVAANRVLVPISNFMASTVQAACVLAVAILGISMISGKARNAWKESAILMTKISLVLVFSNSFGAEYFNANGGLFGVLLDTMNDILDRVTLSMEWIDGGCVLSQNDADGLRAFWLMDCVIENLIGGIYTLGSLAGGLLGFIVASFFSGAIGVFVAAMVGALIVLFCFAVVRAVYIYLISMMALSMMVIISPLVIPLALFQSTVGYFEKWVRKTIGFMLQPIFLFVYISLLISTFNLVIFGESSNAYNPLSLADVLWNQPASGDCKLPPSYRRGSQTLISHTGTQRHLGLRLKCSGAYGERSHGQEAVTFNPRKAASSAGLRMEKLDTGVMGKIGEQFTDKLNWTDSTKDVHGKVMEGADYFKMDMPTSGVDWRVLAARERGSVSDATIAAIDENALTAYFVKLILSLVMAVVLAYIFMILLDKLPFLAANLSGDPIGGTFGVGNLGPPGAGSINKLQKSFVGAGK